MRVWMVALLGLVVGCGGGDPAAEAPKPDGAMASILDTGRGEIAWHQPACVSPCMGEGGVDGVEQARECADWHIAQAEAALRRAMHLLHLRFEAEQAEYERTR